MRLKTRTDIRQLAALKSKRDLNILFKPDAVKAKAVEIPAPEIKKEEVVEVAVPSADVIEVEVTTTGDAPDIGNVSTPEEKVKGTETPEDSGGKMEVDKAEV
jgi:hypothetical protein